MARTLRMMSLTAALIAATALLFSTPQTQAWVTAEAETDMVPVSPARSMMVAIPDRGAGTMAAPTCLQCRCCSKADPSKCEVTNCCSTFNCDPTGKCNLVELYCGCNGC